MTAEEAYKKGFLDGMYCFAWWKDGVLQVGTKGKHFSEARKEVESMWNYLPPPKEDVKP